MLVTIFSIFITLLAYLLSRKAAGKYPSPLTSPVFLSTVIVISVLLILNIPYKEYEAASVIITYFLGPATVALAVPLYKQRKIIAANLLPALAGLFAGTVSTILSAVLIGYLLNLTNIILVSLTIKSITIPVASEVARMIEADPILVAAFVMITGMTGAMLGPWLMNVMKIHEPFSRGLAIGTIAHGIGTAEAAREGELQGAVSGAAMGLAAILTSLLLPAIIPFFL
ncbi:LrgB family protein [Bacillus sp. ISL-35]|uniref:LrgB family protein n=1 Tax=Bacillus sp. ISL-35 TaxID=2819122 RepID=UPI001BEB4CFA|nr:LrgB family protein [Bacillus sp. ISL-35]MBT2677950.1 LrgB family protein [Bacillus sp. ISL-35]MBT2705467.1 LrgB family protein [Chryseobacterium sp. ISL-80]